LLALAEQELPARHLFQKCLQQGRQSAQPQRKNEHNVIGFQKCGPRLNDGIVGCGAGEFRRVAQNWKMERSNINKLDVMASLFCALLVGRCQGAG